MIFTWLNILMIWKWEQEEDSNMVHVLNFWLIIKIIYFKSHISLKFWLKNFLSLWSWTLLRHRALDSVVDLTTLLRLQVWEARALRTYSNADPYGQRAPSWYFSKSRSQDSPAPEFQDLWIDLGSTSVKMIATHIYK